MHTSSMRDETLQSLAYACWVRRGRPLGSPEVDWSEAEQMYAASMSDVSGDDITVVNSALDRTTLIDADSPQRGDVPTLLDSTDIPAAKQQSGRAL